MASPALLDALVLEHLQARGYSGAAQSMMDAIHGQADDRSDEAAADAGRPSLLRLVSTTAAPKWAKEYEQLRDWVHESLDMYKGELSRVLYPLFAFCYLDMVTTGERDGAARFFEVFQADHALAHRDELNLLRQVTAPQQELQNEYVMRLRGRRYEVELSAFARALLLHFIHENMLLLLLAAVNRHLKLKLPTLQPSLSASTTDSSAAGSSRSAASLLWERLDEDELREQNSEPVAWGPPGAVVYKQRQLETSLASRGVSGAGGGGGDGGGIGAAMHAGDEAEASSRKGGSGSERKRRRPEADGDVDATGLPRPEPVMDSGVPLPPLNEKVEKEYAKDSVKRASLERGEPTALLISVMDSKHTLCSVSFSNDCATAACGCADSALRLCMLKPQHGGGKKVKVPSGADDAQPPNASLGGASGNNADAAEEANAWSSGAAGAASRVDEKTGPETLTLRGHSGPVYGSSFSRDDKILVSCSQDGTARLWGLLQRACLVRYDAHATPVWGIAFAPIGTYFATCGYDRTLRVWSVNQVRPLRVMLGHKSDVRCAAFHPNVSLIASGSDDASVRIWDVQSAKCVRLLCRNGHGGTVCCIAFAHGGHLLCSSGEDTTVILWNLSDGRPLCRLKTHTRPVWCVGFSMDDAWLLSAGADCSIAIWNVRAAASGSAEAGGAASEALDNELGASSKDKLDSQFLSCRFYTKFTPLLAAKFSRTNLLLAAGPYSQPLHPAA